MKNWLKLSQKYGQILPNTGKGKIFIEKKKQTNKFKQIIKGPEWIKGEAKFPF